MNYSYDFLSQSHSKSQWQRLGVKRRSGVAVPLFSLYSRQSVGIGEIPDLKRMVDWCQKSGLSILQLLPMNDVGFDFRPYDAQSSFAIDPMYLCLEDLKGINARPFKNEIETIRKKFPTGRARVNYGVKKAKLELLFEIFRQKGVEQKKDVEAFRKQNEFWLTDYALFKVIKDSDHQSGWMNWKQPLKDKTPDAIGEILEKEKERLFFYEWLQWQLFEQFARVKAYSAKKGVYLMGDLPFLVSRDSADVWAHQDYFKSHLCSGAPPDLYFALGQRWGMPPYDWPNIEAHAYDYVKTKLAYAQNFYDLFRIDHVIGVYRLWTIEDQEPEESGGMNGRYDPEDEGVWQGHGEKILNVMVQNTEMVPCGEDLGTIPDCSHPVLEAFGIPGMEVQRWVKDWDGTRDFKDPAGYRPGSISVISTHDLTSFQGWWEAEAGTVDGALFERKCQEKNINFDEMREKLFDSSRSGHGRLRWKQEVRSIEALLAVLGRGEEEVSDLVGEFKATYDEKERFWGFVGMTGEMKETFSPKLMRKTLENNLKSASIFSVQLIHDWLSLDPKWKEDPWEARINYPGTEDEKNWSVVLPWALEEMVKRPITVEIEAMNQAANRV